MKKIIAITALAALPLAVSAQEINGTWQTATSDTGAYLHVEIGACDSDATQICGTITAAFAGATAENIGKPIIWDMQARGDNRWRRGQIWAPDDDKTYRANMTLNGDSLEVEGCVAVFCRGQVWTRVN